MDQGILSYSNLLLPVGAVIINALVQLVYYRVDIRKRLGKSILIGFGFGLSSVIIASLACLYRQMNVETICIALVNLVSYIGLAYCYFGIIGLGISLRIRIIDIVTKYENGCTLQELAGQFNSRGLFEKRIERLVGTGKVRNNNGIYCIASPSMLMMSRVNVRIKKFLTSKESEFN